jgi:NAD(P)-dependent dehydrogenase (short-subunit alcohol dehydrogenase family)
MVLWTLADIPEQHGRIAVITGANSGLGEQAALALAGKGAHVVLACRNPAKAHAAEARIRQVHPAASVQVRVLDLADLSSVAQFADGLAADHGRVDLLLNNAGLMAVDAARTRDGFEMQFGVNHLGHFALTVRLLPLLTATAGSRVVTMSSMGHRAGRMHFDDLMFDRGYSRWQAYFQSKLANLLFTAELQRRLAASGTSTIALAAHPGGSRTDLGTEGRGLSNRLMAAVVPLVTQSAATGALPLLRAATDPAASGGQFYGPRWLAVGHPVLETPAPAARRTADARRLWTESVRLTGVDADLPVAR